MYAADVDTDQLTVSTCFIHSQNFFVVDCFSLQYFKHLGWQKLN